MLLKKIVKFYAIGLLVSFLVGTSLGVYLYFKLGPEGANESIYSHTPIHIR